MLRIELPCEAPKPVPARVTSVPAGPSVGLIEVIFGTGVGTVTVKLMVPVPALVATPTVTEPVATLGTTQTIEVFDQEFTVAVVLANFTVDVPCVAPKLLPVIVTVAPTFPLVGLIELMVGAATVTVKLVLAVPPAAVTVTVTAPAARLGTTQTIELSFQEVIELAVLPNVTEPEVPKLAPEMVTLVPTGPDPGDMPLMEGVAATVSYFQTPCPAVPA